MSNPGSLFSSPMIKAGLITSWQRLWDTNTAPNDLPYKLNAKVYTAQSIITVTASLLSLSEILKTNILSFKGSKLGSSARQH